MNAPSAPFRWYFVVSENLFTLRNVLINAIWFKLVWICCVQFGNQAALVALPLTALIHTTLIKLERRDWMFVLSAVAAGFLFDSVLASTGLVVFAYNGMFPPIWLVTIWFAFGTLVVVTLPYLARNKYLFTGLSAVMGMLSYWAGTSFSDAALGYSLATSLPMLALAWGVMGFLLHLLYVNTIDPVRNQYA